VEVMDAMELIVSVLTAHGFRVIFEATSEVEWQCDVKLAGGYIVATGVANSALDALGNAFDATPTIEEARRWERESIPF
jgi:hypothetical protein